MNDERWYELLNAGFEMKGIAGSDFPGTPSIRTTRPRYIPVIGPERTLVRAKAGASAYESWSNGLRNGEVIVSTGPIVRIESKSRNAVASARFYRPLTRLELIADGKVIAGLDGDGVKTALTLAAPIPESAVWVAARVGATTEKDESPIRAHTNPVFLRHAVADRAARTALADRFASEIEYYKRLPGLFVKPEQKDMFFRDAEATLERLRH
jgi:DNA-dependent RNA polymerase auxiliary subunit epsilon